MPLQFALGVQLDHLFGSKFLLQHVSRLGFCCLYDEVSRFKKSVLHLALASDINEHLIGAIGFTQYVADNVDHNVRTLDGSGTFHGMGMISASVLENGDFSLLQPKIRCLSGSIKNAELCRLARVEIMPYEKNSSLDLRCIQLQAIRSLGIRVVMPPVTKLNIVWHTAALLKSADLSRPNWRGYMQTVCIGDHVPAADIKMLPIIYLSPTDESCILSTLIVVINQSSKLNIVTPCITFDQPLYLKAVDISTAQLLNIVCRLGGFHTLMNFLAQLVTLCRNLVWQTFFHRYTAQIPLSR